MSYIEILDWDSGFFGYKVARARTGLSTADIPLLLQELDTAKVKLAYYFSDDQIIFPDNNSFEVKLVDKKLTYLKQVQSFETCEFISTYHSEDIPEELLNLSLESGHCSRFNVDENIGRQKFEELYRQWIRASLTGQLNYKVLVYKREGNIAGFVTIGNKGDFADIGLIAVDERYRGQGIGKYLVQAAENYCNDSLVKIQVVTQAANKAACRLYEKCGFEIGSTEFVYHLWKK